MISTLQRGSSSTLRTLMYDAALKDLEELENELLPVGSHFIQRNTIKKMGNKERDSTSTVTLHSWVGTDVDRVAVLLDLWTCETEFLESKVQAQCLKMRTVDVIISDISINVSLCRTFIQFSQFSSILVIFQLLNCYCEACQHATGTEERFVLALFMTSCPTGYSWT